MYHQPAHKDVKHPAGQVQPAPVAVLPLQFYVDIVSPAVKLGNADKTYGVRQVIERTWFRTFGEAVSFQRERSRRYQLLRHVSDVATDAAGPL